MPIRVIPSMKLPGGFVLIERTRSEEDEREFGPVDPFLKDFKIGPFQIGYSEAPYWRLVSHGFTEAEALANFKARQRAERNKKPTT